MTYNTFKQLTRNKLWLAILIQLLVISCGNVKKPSTKMVVKTKCTENPNLEGCNAGSSVFELSGNPAFVHLTNPAKNSVLVIKSGPMEGLEVVVPKNSFESDLILSLSMPTETTLGLVDSVKNSIKQAFGITTASLSDISVSGSRPLKNEIEIYIPSALTEKMSSEDAKNMRVVLSDLKDLTNSKTIDSSKISYSKSTSKEKYKFSMKDWASFIVTSDVTPPTLAFKTTSDASNSEKIMVQLIPNEKLINFTAANVAVTNGVIDSLLEKTGYYVLTVTPSGLGDVSIKVEKGKLIDISRNFSIQDFSSTVKIDKVKPTVTISSASNSSTNQNPISYTVSFNESVTGLTAADFLLVNGSIAGLTGSGATYTATVTPGSEGVVSISLPANTVMDIAGNANEASTQVDRTYDATVPTVTLGSTASEPTSTSPIPLTITFSEAVNDFTISDLVILNGTASSLAGSGTSYTVNVTPTTTGAVTVDLPANMATDAAGNSNTAATQFTRTFDTINATLVLSTAAGSATASSPIPVTATFSKSMTGFTAGDIDVSNGLVSGFAGSGSVYTFNLTPTGQGAVTASVLANQAIDVSSNGNLSSNVLSVVYDTVVPTVSLSSTSSATTSTSPIPITVTFSESVTGFTSSDIVVTNGTVGNFSGSGSTYTFDLTPTSQGAITVNVASSVAQDQAGNNNTAASQLNRTYDSTIPSVVISSTSPTNTNISPIPVTVTFSEAVTGFTSGQLTLAGGSASNFAGSGATYTFDFTPSVQGAVTVDIAAGSGQDAAGNLSTAASQFTRQFDNVIPTVAITSTASSPTGTSPIPMTITFSEAVTGFAVGDLTLSGGAASGFAGSGAVYTFNFVPSGTGTKTVEVASASAADAAGNGNSISNLFSINYDESAPSVVISSTSTAVTNVSPVPFTVTFSESVSNFIATDITVTGGTIGSFAGSGSTYTFNLTPSGQGTLTVDVAAGVAQDASGNNNTAATQVTRTFDNSAPSVTLSSSAATVTPTAPIPVTVTFSESITGFLSSMIAVSGGSIGNFSGSGTTYTFDITPSGQGVITVDVAANQIQDSAGNNNTAATQLTRTYDSVAPTVVVSTAVSSPTNLSTIPVTVTFSESVTGFTQGDLALVGGTTINFVGSGTTYTFDFIPSGNGTKTIEVPSGSAVDLAATANTISNTLSIVYDTSVPSVVITSTATSSTNTSPIPITVTFSESVTGFVVGDITLTGGTPSSFSGSGAVYTFDLTPSGQGPVTVDVAANVAKDSSNNDNTAATQFTRIYDTVQPTVSITSTSSATTAVSPIPVTVTFSESVSGFTVTDLTLSGGSASNFVGSGTTYTFDFTPSGQGVVSVDIAANIAQDAATNNNLAATQFVRTYSSNAPSVTLTSASSAATNTSPISVTATFSLAVTGFAAGDIVTSGGTVGNFAGSGTTYTFDVTPSGQGAVTVDVPANAAQSASSVNNTAATQLSRVYDTVSPSVTISSASSSNTNTSPIPVTVTFSESVTGFVVGDLTISGGSASGFAGSGTTYTFNLTPSGQGTVTVDIAANVASDAASNNNTAATQFARSYDSIVPTVAISSTSPSITNTSPIPVTITFSESVTGFVIGDISVTGGTKSALSGSGSTYTFDLTPSGQGAITVDVAANVAVDASGNNNTAATQLTRTYDSVASTVSITSSESSPTATTPIPMTVTFSESVTGFALTDLSLVGGTASNLTGSGSTYNFDFSPSGNGLKTIDLAGNSAQDAATNGNTAASQFSITFNSSVPTVSITSTTNPSTNVSPMPITVTFSESMTGFTSGDITLAGGTLSSFAGSGATYTFDFTPSGQGTKTIDIAGNVAINTLSVGNSAATQFTRIYDTVAPTVTITSTAAATTNVSPIPVTVTFSESVTGFAVGDLVVAGGSASGFAGSGTTYTFNLTPSGPGTVTVDLAANQAQDAAGNNNTAASQLSRVYDSSVPTVTISSAAGASTNVSPIPVTVTFSESVTGFVVGDLTLSGGTASGFAGSGTTYTFNLTPSGQGAVTVDVGANVAQDAGSNNNTAATQFTRIYDTVQPTVTISSIASSPTATSPIPVTVTFSESVTGFVVGDLTLSGGTASAFAGSGTTYTFDLTPSGQGTVTVDLTANKAVDAAGNNNTAATQLSRVYDSVVPTVTISSTSSSITNTSPIPVTVTFSESVVGFAIADITVTGGTKSALSGSGSTYTFDLTPSGQGAVTVDVAANVAQDASGNNNTAAAQLTRTYDTVQPTVTISSTAPSLTNVSPIPVTVTFSESVTGFVVGDLTLSGGTASAFAGSGTTYTFNLTPSGQGTVTVDIAANVAQDAATNNNTAATQLVRTYDSVAPTVTISSTAPSVTNTSPIPVTITFSESVTGFVVGDITLSGGTSSGFAGSGTTYTFDLHPTGQGVVTVNVAANVAVDATGNNNTAAAQLSRTYDTVQPTVTLSSATTSSTNSNPIPVTVTFSESVTGFAIADIVVTGGTKSALSGSGSTYTFDITPTGQGAITVNVAASVATDAGGNNNTIATQLSRTFDSVAPTVSISSTAPATTNTSPIPVTVTFSESVTGFVVGDLTLSGGTASGFAGSGTTYTFNLTPSGQGTVTVDIAANVAVDAASNNNTVASQLSRIYDTAGPTVTISTTAPASTNVSPIPVTVTFSESVTGFVVGDLTLSGGTASGFAGSGTTYTFNLTPTGQGTVTVDVAGSVAQDSGANNNSAATQLSRIYDTVSPTVVISSTTSSVTSTSPIPVTVTFSESVTGFVNGDIVVTGGTKSGFAGSGTTYTFNLTPTGQGALTVDIAAAVAADAAGNNNTIATQLTRTYDSVAPTVSITSTASAVTNTSPIPITVTFSESVTGFVVGDLTLTGGTASGFAGSGTTYTFNLTPSGQGAVTVDVAANVAQDAATTNNTAATQLTRTYDSVQPTVSITSTAPAVTSTSPIPVTVTFSESVTGFVVGDITLTGGTASGFAGSGTTYTLNVTPSGQGVVTVNVAAGVAQDTATNTNTVASQLSRTYDTAGPTVTITSTSTSPTNDNPIPITITFSESVTGLTAAEVVVTNATKSALSGSGTTYTMDLTPTAQGAVTINVAANVAQDAGTNNNSAATQLSLTYDSVAPTVTITSTSTSPTNDSPIPMTVTFSESVTGFVVGDLTLVGGTASAFAGSGTTYTFSFTPSGQGAKTIDVAAARATDAAGNDNTAATQFAITFDSVSPTVSITSSETSPSNASPFPMTITFSESVTGFVVGDITVTGGTKSAFAGSGTTYTFSFTPTGEGAKTISVAAAVAADASGNTNTASSTFNITYDITAPTVTITSSAPDYTNVSPIPVTITFSESVTGLVIGDITVSSGTKGALSGSGTTYTFNLTPTAQGAININVAAGVAQDAAGNTNTVATQITRTYDTVAPGAFTLTGPGAATTSPIPEFSWTAASGVSTYTMIIATASGCASGVIHTLADLTVTKVRPTYVLDNGSYYACLTAYDLATNSRVATGSNYAFTVTNGSWLMGQDSFSTTRSETGLNFPGQVTSDGTRMFVADTFNNRVLIWNTVPTANNVAPNVILGQNNMAQGTSSGSQIFLNYHDAQSMKSPTSVFSDGTKLYVADSAAHRVLIWNTIPTQHNTPADVVLGQPSFSGPVANNGGLSASSLSTPVAVTKVGTKLIVADSGNHRVLIWNTVPTVNNTAANIVLGQPNFVSNTSNNGGISATSLSNPYAVYATGTILYVVDYFNNRVLKWNDISTAVNGQAANVVLGQSAMTLGTPNEGGSTTASTLSCPRGVSGNGTKLFVADTCNHRVAIWNTTPTTNGQAASVVIGQTSLTGATRNSGGVSASSVAYPSGVHTSGGKVFVADYYNARILVWNAIPTANMVAADVLYGQTNFTTAGNMGETTGKNILFPRDISTDGTRLLTTDNQNDRLLLWTTMPTSAAPNPTANFALGQSDLVTANAGGYTANRLSGPQGAIIAGSKLIVADSSNHRILIFNTIPTGHQPNADVVLGQANFLTNTYNFGGLSASSMYYPMHVAVSGTKLAVADVYNNRVLIWNTIPTVNNTPADVVLGQPDFTSDVFNNGGISASSLGYPRSLAFWGSKLVVADTNNNRVLIWNTVPTSNGTPADLVLGRPDFTTGNASVSDKGLRLPYGVFAEGTKLLVADSWSHRIMIWNTAPTTNYQPADVIFGQSDATSWVPNLGGPSKTTLQFPTKVMSYGNQMYIVDSNNNRILIVPL